MAITQNGVLQRDDNDTAVMGGTSSSDNNTIINSAFDPVTRRLLTDAGASVFNLTVEAGLTSVSNVDVITFTGATVTDDGGGAVTVAITGAGTVDTVVGTANRIVVDSTDPANPVVNISTNYVGQNTITTLGTITTGVWNGTLVAGQYGGTGVANTGKTITIGGNFEISGAFTFTGTVTGNTSVTFPTSGTLATTTYVPTTITVADEATDTSCFIAFFTAATGDLGPKTNTNMTFDSNTGVATFASTVLTTTDINGGTIDGTTIGATTPTTGVFTTATVNTGLMPDANDGAYLGQAGTGFSDLFFAEGAVINWDSGDVTLTQTNNVIEFAGGDLRVATAGVGTNADSVATLSSTSTFTNKTLTSPTINTATLGGAQQLAEGASIRLDQTLSADGTYSGTTIAGTAGATLAFGDWVYLAAADSRWELTDADAAATAGSVLVGVCVLAAASDGDPTVILLDGNIRADAAFPSFTVSAPIYLSTSPGDVTNTAPSATDDVVRVVGFGLTADSMVVSISPDYITIV